MTDSQTTSISLLGVKGGPAIKPGSNMPSATLIRMAGRTILVDAGLGAARAVCDQGVALTEIDLILITHLHSDHYLELGPILHTAWVSGLVRPIPVIGPAGLSEYWAGFLQSMAFDIELRMADEGRTDLAELTQFSALSEGPVFDQDGLCLTALRNHHPPIKDSFALRFDYAGQRIVHSGDTAAIDGMINFARGADVLVHEVLLEAGVDRLCASLNLTDGLLKRHLIQSHASAPEVGRIATMAGVKHLVLTHFVPGSDPGLSDKDWTDAVRQTWKGPLTLGRDGLLITL